MNIIDDASKYTNLFLVGDLYVKKSGYFYENYIKNKYEITQKNNINWCNNLVGDLWKVCKSTEIIKELSSIYKNNTSVNILDSDKKVIEKLIEKFLFTIYK